MQGFESYPWENQGNGQLLPSHRMTCLKVRLTHVGSSA